MSKADYAHKTEINQASELSNILDILCGGRAPSVEARLREELTEHYTEIYTGALEEGIDNIAAHEKALNDMGWNTTSKLVRILHRFDKDEKRDISNTLFPPRPMTFPKNSDPINWRFIGVCWLIMFALSLYEKKLFWSAFWFLSSGTVLGSYYYDRWQYRSSKVSVLQSWNIERALLRHLSGQCTIPALLIAFVFYYEFFPLPNYSIWQNAAIFIGVLAICLWAIMSTTFRFILEWNRDNPMEKIFVLQGRKNNASKRRR